MTATTNDLTCPKCGHKNPAKADYCWECRYDFVHDERLKSGMTAPKAPVPPPYSAKAAEPTKGRQKVSPFAFVVELVASTVIVGGSWMGLKLLYADMTVLMFVAGWILALALVKFSEGRLPDAETDWREYYSMNPFEFKDDRNRFILDWHITLFLPRVVLHTLRRGFILVSGG